MAEDDPYAPMLVDDLLTGLNDWKHVHDIVRLTFKALSDVLRTQGAAIGEIERILPTKVSKSEFSASLSGKANLSDIHRSTKDFPLEKPFSLSTIEPLLKDKLSKSDLQTVLKGTVSERDMRQMLDQKVGLGQFSSDMSAVQGRIEEVQTSIGFHITRLENEIAELCRVLDQKADSSEVDKLGNTKANRQSVINALHAKASRDDLEAALGRKANVEHVEECVGEIKELRKVVEAVGGKNSEFVQQIRMETYGPIQRLERELESISHSISQKADIDKFGGILSSLKQEQVAVEERITAQIREIAKSQEGLEKDCEDRMTHVQDSLFSLTREISSKRDVPTPDHHRFLSLLDDLNKRKVDISDFLDLRRQLSIPQSVPAPDLASLKTEHKQDVDRLTGILLDHTNKIRIELTQYVESIVSRTIGAPGYSRKDISRELESKTNFEDINQTLVAIHKDIESKVSVSDFTLVLSNVEMLLSEHCLARWLWTSGTQMVDKRVPWEVQTVNTRPDNFVWEDGDSDICTVAPGLYGVAVGVFARTRPKIQLFVNDQAVVRLGFGEREDTGKQWTPHVDGNIIGLTFSDTLALPTRARLHLTVDSEWRAEAYLGLRKL